jgi:Arc/MetJ-type ribon-helix-helix transcriptional regulator
MRVQLSPKLQRYIEDQVRTGRFESEELALRIAVAKMMLADHDVEMSADELATLHDPTLHDHEKVLDQMLEKHCVGARS